MWHYILTHVFIVLSFLNIPTTTYHRMVDKVSSSVVRVTGQVEGGLSTCTGEVIAANRVLTAAHCVHELMWADGVVVTVLKVDEYYDLALLKVDTTKPIMTFRDTPADRFEDLTAIGYAWGFTKLSVFQVRSLLVNIEPDPTMAPGLIVQPGYIGGLSGGPVVDSEGRMVGIIQRSNDGAGYGIQVLLIRAFLLGTN